MDPVRPDAENWHTGSRTLKGKSLEKVQEKHRRRRGGRLGV